MPDVLYVQLEVDWLDSPKLIAAGMEGRGLHATALCLSKRLAVATDGWLDRALLRREGATDDAIDRGVAAEILEVDEVGRVRPWHWLDRNPSQAAIAAKRASKVRAGRKGNHSKHGHPGDVDACPVCSPEVEEHQVTRTCDPVRSQAVAPPSPETETETETTPLSDSQGSSGSEPVVPSQHDKLRAVRLIAEAVTSDLGAVVANPTSYAFALRRNMHTDPDAMARITTALAAGSSPEDIAGSWLDNGKGAAGAERVGSVGDDVRRPVDVARPALPEVRATEEPRPPAAVAAAGIALARGAVSGSTPVSAGDHRNTSSRPGGGATAPNPTTLAVVR